MPASCSCVRVLALAAVAGVGAGLGGVGVAEAGIIPVNRLSQITFNGLNLNTGGEPGPDQAKSTTDLTAPFNDSLIGDASTVVIGGATNTGHWNVSQDTSISALAVASSVSQSATTATDFDSPGIFTLSSFLLDFQVDAVTQVTLDGSIVGVSDPANNDFARVQLKQGATSIFNTSFPSLPLGQFPFTTTLQPGTVYTLTVEASGQTLFNNSTESAATLSMTVVPEPAGMLTLGALGVLALRGRRRVGSAPWRGSPG